MNVAPSELKALMESHRRICVYGLSPDASKPSHTVPLYMKKQGWEVVGIYPRPYRSADFIIYSSLAEVPLEERRFLDVFRSSEKIPELVDEVLAVGGVEVLWLQLGISHPEAEKRAQSHGLKVVSDRCLVIEHSRR